LQRWRIGIGLAVFAASALVGFAVARPLAPATLHREIETRLSELFGSPVHVADVRLSFRWGLLLEGQDITVWATGGGPALRVARATAELRPFAHLTGQARIRRLRFEKPVLRVTQHADGSITPAPAATLFADTDDDTTEAPEPPGDPLRFLAAGEPFARSLLTRMGVADSVEIAGGRIELVDLGAAPHRSLAVAPLHARLSRSLFGKTKFTLRGRFQDADGDRGAFEWESDKSPEQPLRVALAATGLELAALLPWVPPLRSHTPLGGSISGALSFEASEPGHGRLEIDLVAQGLDSQPPARPQVPGEADRVALHGTIAIDPDELRVEGARITSDDLSLEVDATVARPLGLDARAELALAVRDVAVTDLRRVLGRLPQIRREEAEALLASVRKGRLRLLRTGGTATLAGWQDFLVSRDPVLPRDFVVDADLADATVHVENEDYLESISGRLWWTGNRVEFRDFRARLDGTPLPRLDLTVHGVSHLFASDPAAREMSATAPPLEGLRTLWLSTAGESRTTGPDANLRLDIDHLEHPMFYWPIQDATAHLESVPEGVQISIEHGRWADVPVSGKIDWTFEPTERVRAEFTAVAAPDVPASPERNGTWAQGRFRTGAFESERWAHESMEGDFAARGSTLELEDVEIALAPRGHARATGRLDVGQPDVVPIGLRFDIENGDLPSLARTVGLSRHLTQGSVGAEGVLTTTLRAESSFVADLTGRIAVDARDGTIALSVPEALVIPLDETPEGALAEADDIPVEVVEIEPDSIQYETLQTELDFEAGILRTEALNLEGPELRAFASGEVDIDREPHTLDAEVVIFLLRPVDSVLGMIPLVNLLLLGPNDNLVAAHYQITGPWDDPESTLLPIRSFTSGPGTVVFETLPFLVRRGIESLGMLFKDRTPESPSGPAAFVKP